MNRGGQKDVAISNTLLTKRVNVCYRVPVVASLGQGINCGSSQHWHISYRERPPLFHPWLHLPIL